jgi:rhodanese-related sulfurtransferase
VVAAPVVAPAAPAPAPVVAAPAVGKQAKVCATCHGAPPAGSTRGHFDEVAIMANAIQLKVDSEVEVLSFDPATLKVVNGPEGANLEAVLKGVKKGAESRVDTTMVNGVRTVTVLTMKPKLKVAEEKQIKTAEMEKLVAMGPEKGKYFLFDARPFPRYAEGYIPTADSLPFPAFEQQKAKLPADKGALVIYYCAGVTCAMSPAALGATEKLGYTNAKVYHEGLPVWSRSNPGALSPKLLQEAWLAKGQPIVILDARKVPRKGIVPGAAALADTAPAALEKVLKLKKLRPPVVVYDETGGGNSVWVAKALVAQGQPAMVLTGGLAAWTAAGLPVADALPVAAVAFTPKPKPGELPIDEFKKLVAAPQPGTLILDVRAQEELADGVFPGSVNIPATQLSARLAELPKDKRIVTHCSTGIRAEMTYNVLKQAGFPNVAFLNAGVDFFGGKAEIGAE